MTPNQKLVSPSKSEADEHLIFEKSNIPRPVPVPTVDAEGKPLSNQEKKRLQKKKRGVYRGPIYCRSSNAARRKLEQGLLDLYGRARDKGSSKGSFSACVLPSGMAAIGAVMSTALSKFESKGGSKALIVHGDELYSDVFRTVKYMEQTQGAEGIAVNVHDTAALIKLFSNRGQNIRIFHWEAASNPSSQMLDVSILPNLRKLAPMCLFVCDNTWLSGAAFNPLDHGADIVVESMTKYLSGGACIGGMAVGHAEALKPVQEYIRVMGVFMDAERCQLFSDQLKGTLERVSQTAKAALLVAKWLEADERVLRVDYPLLPSHDSFRVASKLLAKGLGPGCVWFMLPVSKSKYVEVVSQKESPIEFKTSFGGPKSRVDPWPKADTDSDHDAATATKKNGLGKATVWVRLALGFDEPAEETIEKLKSLFAQLGV